MRLCLASSIVGLLVACAPATPGGPDAPDPSDAPDAPGARDAPDARDAGRDAPGRDVPRDTGEPTTWTRIARSLPDWCTLERADNPERIPDVALRWEPCPERDNCLRTPPLGGAREARWLSVSDGSALGWFDDSDGRTHVVVVPLDGGSPVAVFRADSRTSVPGCNLWPGDLGEGRVALALWVRSATTAGMAFFTSPIESAGAIDEPVAYDTTHYELDVAQELFVTRTALFVEAQPINLLFSEEDGAHVPIFVEAEGPHFVGAASAFADTIVFGAWGEPPYIARGDAHTRGGAAYFRQDPWRITWLSTDGVELTWLAVFDTWAADGSMILRRDVELWTAPYVVDPAALAPRRVRVMNGWDFPAAGPGIFAMSTGSGTPLRRYIEIVDLADGRMRVYETPGESGTSESPLLVTPELVVYPDIRSLVQFDPRLVPYQRE